MKTPVKFNLTEGPIFNKLFKLSLPIMATSLMQTAHSLINMFWLSWLGEGYVAAAGLASQFLWLSMSLIFLCQIGAEIGVSQNMGKGELETAKSFSQNGFMLAMLIGIAFTFFAVVFRVTLLSFFNIGSEYVAHVSQQYLAIAALSIPFNFGHFVITGVFGGCGNTKLPFYINSAALLLNAILSPIFIFGFGMGISGAALSMVIAAAFNLSIKIWAITRYKNRPFEHYRLIVKLNRDRLRQIMKWGTPEMAARLLFISLFMVVTRLVTAFGEGAVAAQQIGLQIESLSFMVVNGFSSALTAFVGQNYGARRWDRLNRAIKVSYIFMGAYGLFITAVLFIFAFPLVSIFLSDPMSIEIGARYLQIMAFAQFLFCMEGVASGSFRGRGLTMCPSIASAGSNIFRVFICYALAATSLGIFGVWWGITAAMTVRSVWVLVWHRLNMRKQQMSLVE